MIQSDVSPAQLCTSCGRPLRGLATFCGICGARQPVAGSSDVPNYVAMTVRLYVLSLAITAAAMIYVLNTDDGFTAVTAGTIAFSILILGFAIRYRDLVRDSVRTAGFGPKGYGYVLLASVPILLLVAGYVEAVRGWFGIQLPGDLAEFEGRHLAWPILFMVLLPPLTEELAFRGLIYGGLRRVLTVNETFLISSFAFAMLHLSVPSLVTHFPIGLYFCWLRHRSGSLWPGVFAHFCHNLGVMILELT